ncbi:hypothetical protein GIB67_010803 [Kingdonia uniflora]|uniref:Uncharacterized protein n=1 Tax=Kingdonia uniflora TaxID=39325 RepID=A0A7J7L8W3_9MAGN|nr:hypothetical protein GIB67_010803 [Kingdonia uniflora]
MCDPSVVLSSNIVSPSPEVVASLVVSQPVTGFSRVCKPAVFATKTLIVDVPWFPANSLVSIFSQPSSPITSLTLLKPVPTSAVLLFNSTMVPIEASIRGIPWSPIGAQDNVLTTATEVEKEIVVLKRCVQHRKIMTYEGLCLHLILRTRFLGEHVGTIEILNLHK